MTTTLLDSWTELSTTNDNQLVITLDAAVPVGTKLILGTNKSVATANGVTSIVDNKGHTWTKRAHTCRGGTHDMSLHDTVVSTALASGDTITITFAASNTRKTAILAAFSQATSINADSGNNAYGATATNVGPNGSSASVSASTTGAGVGLVIGMLSRAGGAVLTPTVGTTIATVTTAAGTSDRGFTMTYLLDAASSVKTMTGTLAASQGWAAIAASFDATLSGSVLPSDVIVGGAKKTVVGQSVIIGGAKKTIVGASVIVGGAKKPLV